MIPLANSREISIKSETVFIGFSEVSGYFKSLCQGFRELNIDCRFFDFENHPFAYGGADDGSISKMINLFSKMRNEHSGRWFMRKVWRICHAFALSAFFLWALLKFDIFIFGYGTSFFELHDLPLLRFFRKKVIFVFFGSDSRPAYMDGAINASREISAEELFKRIKLQKAKLHKIEAYATATVNLPSQSQFHRKPFVNFLEVGLCTGVSRLIAPESAAVSARDPKTVRILHAPSNSAAKGTSEIVAAVQKLQDSGRKLDLVLVSGKPHSVVVDELRKCDLVIDQMYSDTCMPAFATEAAWFSKPVLIAGYAAEKWKQWVPASALPPTYYCLPKDFEGALKLLVDDNALRDDLGRRARKFVEERWAPVSVAKRFLEISTQKVPPSWICDPMNIDYFEGFALTHSRLKILLRRLTAGYGPEGLLLSDKPLLLKLILDFSDSPD